MKWVLRRLLSPNPGINGGNCFSLVLVLGVDSSYARAMRRGEESLVSVTNKKSVGRRMMKVFNNQADRRHASKKRISQKSHSGSDFPNRTVWCFRQNVAVELISVKLSMFLRESTISPYRSRLWFVRVKSNDAVPDVSRPSASSLSKNCTQLSFSPSLYVSSMFFPIFLTVLNCPAGGNSAPRETTNVEAFFACVTGGRCKLSRKKVLSSLQSPSKTFHPTHRHD